MSKSSTRGDGQLVSWYFEPSQPQRITSGLKTNLICLLVILHTSHRTINSQKSTKSVSTQITQDIHIQTQNTKFSKN